MTDGSLMRGFPPPPREQVTLENFRDFPYLRWSLLNMRELLPTANVSRGTGNARALEHAPLDLDSIRFEGGDGSAMTVAQLIEDGYTDGFIVLKDGRIATERYFNDLRPDQPHLLQSISKSFAGVLAGILADRGALDPDAPVVDIIPEIAGSVYADATVRHVLDMTVGIEFDEDYENPESEVGALAVAIGWAPRVDREVPDGLRHFLGRLQPEGEHGAMFHYVSANSDLLGWVLERTSGLSFAELLSREIWQPMGAEFDAYIALDRLGAPITCGGLCVALRDLARFGQLNLEGGAVDGRQIVPRSWIEDTLSRGDNRAWTRGEFIEQWPKGSYRNQWWVSGDDHGVYCGFGIHGQVVYVDPAAGVVIAKQSTHPLAWDEKRFADLLCGFGAIGRELAS
jgi:CubicO group peptidase (beta-lactamase class C family)